MHSSPKHLRHIVIFCRNLVFHIRLTSFSNQIWVKFRLYEYKNQQTPFFPFFWFPVTRTPDNSDLNNCLSLDVLGMRLTWTFFSFPSSFELMWSHCAFVLIGDFFPNDKFSKHNFQQKTVRMTMGYRWQNENSFWLLKIISSEINIFIVRVTERKYAFKLEYQGLEPKRELKDSVYC